MFSKQSDRFLKPNKGSQYVRGGLLYIMRRLPPFLVTLAVIHPLFFRNKNEKKKKYKIKNLKGADLAYSGIYRYHVVPIPQIQNRNHYKHLY